MPGRWCGVKQRFRKHQPQLRENFLEEFEAFLKRRESLLEITIGERVLLSIASLYASAAHQKSSAMSDCANFFDGTVIGIARRGDHMKQLVVYNGQKGKQGLKYRGITTTEGLVLSCFSPMEG